MYCSKCGTKLGENANFCQKCGTAVIQTNVNVQAQTVQTPANVQTPAPVTAPPQPVRQNAFTFVSIAITGVLILLFFLPSLVVNGKNFSMFTSVTNVIQMDIVPFFFCAILMFAAEVLLVLAFIFMLTKKGNVLKFIIPAAGITVFTLFFFWLTDYAISFATTTAVPVFMLILSVANFVFYLISRKAGK